MPYDPETTWPTWSNLAASHGSNAIRMIHEWEEVYQDWQTFRAGRTDAQLATALGKTTTDIAAVDSAFAAFHVMYNSCNNVAGPVAGDRFYAWRVFA